MEIKSFVELLNADFFTGVPDSQLRSLCDYLMNEYGIDGKHHVIAANEGNCVALAAGYHLATGKIPVVYMQNSGEGNIINPLASLLNDKVYAIPCIFVIGWRGEPNVHDEPQHIYQGEVTLSLLNVMGVEYFVIDKLTTTEQIFRQMEQWQAVLQSGKQVAFVVKKGALTYENKVEYKNNFIMTRERAIEIITNIAGNDPIISTTGKASRELFEIRERQTAGHGFDFLTVGSMGHASSIAMGVAIHKPDKIVWCIDGDGSSLMHMGAMAVIGANALKNLKHIVINNGAHETVGGMPTVADKIDLCRIAEGCRYQSVYSISDEKALQYELKEVKNNNKLTFIEVKCALGARSDLGRPTTTAAENKVMFMDNLNK